MEVMGWIGQNWFEAIQSLGIIAGLVFTVVGVRNDAKSRQIGNLFAVTSQHRELWNELATRPDLARVTDPKADLSAKPITPAEEIFVNSLVLHLSTAFRAIRAGLMLKPDQIQTDVREFFSLPIPKAVWGRCRQYQDHDLTLFVESCLASLKQGSWKLI